MSAPARAANGLEPGEAGASFLSSDPASGGATPAATSPGWRRVAIQGPAPTVRLIPDPQRMASDPAMAPAPSREPSPRWRPRSPIGAPAAASGPADQPGDSPPVTSPSPPRSRGGRLPADSQAVAAAPVAVPYLLTPSLGGGVPSGYVGGWGDYYVAASAGTPGNLRGGSPDASINMGFGLGDPVRYAGLSVNWGIGSVKRFNGNGSFGFAVGRILLNRPNLQVAVAGGMLDAYTYGFEEGKPQANGYGAVSVSVPLRPNDPVFPQRLQFSAGAGGNSFSAIDADFITSGTGYFGSVGVEVTPYLGLSFGQSSRGTNVNVSLIPFRSLPIFVNLIGADLFANTPFGTVGVLSVGWGDNLRRGFITR